MDTPSPPAPVRAVQLTLAEVLEAARATYLFNLVQPRVLSFLGLSAVLAFGFGAYMIPADPPNVLWGLGAAGITIGYLGLMFGLIYLLRVPSAIRRQWRENKMLHERFDISWQDGHYRAIGETHRSELPWSHYRFWRETPNVILLHISTANYQLCAKRWFDAEQLADLRRTIAQSGLPKREGLFSRAERPGAATQ